MIYDRVFPATWVSDDGKRYFSVEARKLGYLSSTGWKVRNRAPDPSAVPSLVVLKFGRGSGDPCAPILRVLPNDEYEYAAEFYCVFPEADTVVAAPERRKSRKSVIAASVPSDPAAEIAPDPNSGKTIDQQSDLSSFFSPESSSPYDASFSSKAIPGKDLTTTKMEVPPHPVNNGVRTKRSDRKAEEWEYLPEGFDWSKVPKALTGGVRYLFHLLYINRVIRRIENDEFIHLNARTFKRIVWNGDAIRYWATKSGLVQCDNFYEKGRKSLGYRLCPELAQRTWRLTRRTNKAIVRNLRKTAVERSPVVAWLTKNLGRIEAEMPVGLPWADELALQAVNDGCIAFNPEDEFGRRYHSNLTNLRSDLRKYLRVDGQPLVQIDISNSQPLFQAVVAERYGVVCPAYKKVCEEGRLYEFLGEKTGLTRKRTKQQMMSSVFFGRNASRSRTKRAFRKYFAEVATLLDKIKADDHAELARLLQRAESEFIVRTVCDRLRRKHPRMFATTIHDSIVTNSPANAAIVLETMREEFARLGIEPKLEIEDL